MGLTAFSGAHLSLISRDIFTPSVTRLILTPESALKPCPPPLNGLVRRAMHIAGGEREICMNSSGGHAPLTCHTALWQAGDNTCTLCAHTRMEGEAGSKTSCTQQHGHGHVSTWGISTVEEGVRWISRGALSHKPDLLCVQRSLLQKLLSRSSKLSRPM